MPKYILLTRQSLTKAFVVLRATPRKKSSQAFGFLYAPKKYNRNN
ncbi:hypothetical protein [Bernardetia litoralis]|nr:hypothetical protein [Bernardetia litoralis]